MRKSQCDVRTKWVAWTGPRPTDTNAELVQLCGDLGLSHLAPRIDLPRIDVGTIQNLGVGVEANRPVCLYIDCIGTSERLRRIRRVGATDVLDYTFDYLPLTTDGRPALLAVPPSCHRLATSLIRDPVVRAMSGFWLRSDGGRVYITFPHHPPVSQLWTLLGDDYGSDGLAEYADHHFRHVCIHGTEEASSTIYLSGSSEVFPHTFSDLRERVAVSARSRFESDATQRCVRMAELVSADERSSIDRVEERFWSTEPFVPDADLDRTLVSGRGEIGPSASVYDIGAGDVNVATELRHHRGCRVLAVASDRDRLRIYAEADIPCRSHDPERSVPPGIFDHLVLGGGVLAEMQRPGRLLEVIRPFGHTLHVRLALDDRGVRSSNGLTSAVLMHYLQRGGWQVMSWRASRSRHEPQWCDITAR